ncbi:reverse transcriptase domain-containing protein [Tanacetum coccineum]
MLPAICLGLGIDVQLTLSILPGETSLDSATKFLVDETARLGEQKTEKLDSNNQDQQQLLKKQNVVQAYAVGSGEKIPYGGSKPLCLKCNYHHDGECAPKCTNWDDDEQSSGGGIRRPVQPARVCTYPGLLKCQPLNFKGTKGVVGLSQWLEKMESVFHISGCAVENQVKFATCTLLGAPLTWWNGHVRTLGHDAAYAMTWEMFKKKLTDKYSPNEEIKKLEKSEMWISTARRNDVLQIYTQQFSRTSLDVHQFLADESNND